MNTAEFLIDLRAKGIALWRDNDTLRYRGPKGAVTADIRSQLAERKTEILALLERASSDAALPLPLSHDPDRCSTEALSYAEESLWLLNQIRPGSAWNMQSCYRLRGALNVGVLGQSLNELIKRQHILRTGFKLGSAGPVRTIAPTLKVEIPLTELGASTDSEEAIRRIAADEAKHLFELRRAPLFRTCLVRIHEQDHAFIVTMHHMITDARSTRTFFQELFALYEAFSQGRSSPLQDLPVHYADYAAWVRAKGVDRQVSHWQSKLAGLTLTEFPPDRPGAVAVSGQGAREQIRLEKTLAQKLRRVCAAEHASLFMLMVTAFKILLRRSTGSADITLGAVVSGRSEPELEALVGLFVNIIVLRTDLSGEPTFRELLRRVREVCLEGYEHRDLPLERVVDALGIGARGGRHHRLFQVLFEVNHLSPIDLDITGLKVEPLTVPANTSRYELVLRIPVSGEDIGISADYSTDLFSRDRIVELLEQYKILLEQIAESPDQGIDSYSILTPTARRALPDPTEPLNDGWYGAVHEFVSQHARRQAEKIAVQDSQDCWTYRELNERSNQLASYLLSRGIGRQDIVALYARRHASLIWALLGILKSGAAFSILDPAHPPLRLKHCLDVLKPKVLIQSTSEEKFPGEVEDILRAAVTDDFVRLPRLAEARRRDFLSAYSKTDPDVRVTADDLAYVIFTSGSTGKPKAVLGRHGPLTHFLDWSRDTFGISDGDRFSVLAGLSSNILQREIFTGLALGGTLCLPDPDPVGMFTRLDEWMRSEAVTAVHLTPAMAQVLSDGLAVPTVNHVFFAGDLLRWRDIRRIRRCMPNAAVINFYASSETQRACGYKSFPKETARGEQKDLVSLGRGVKDVQLLVVNGSGELAGVGELGEIWVRSPHLARGYLGDDPLTRERFIVSPFTGKENDRIFRTGERGRYLPNGEVEYVSRGENQVSVRGFRVELGEIESVLMDHPSVKAAVVAGYDEPAQRLIAYVVPMSGGTVNSSDLRRYLRKKLPDYMIPARFMILQALPISPTGKVDRSALPAPDGSRPELESGYVAPRSGAEERVADIWAQALKLQRVGVHDNFFDLGGHSLLATQIVSRVGEAFGVQLPLRLLFEGPTVEELALAIEEVLVDEIESQS